MVFESDEGLDEATAEMFTIDVMSKSCDICSLRVPPLVDFAGVLIPKLLLYDGFGNMECPEGMFVS